MQKNFSNLGFSMNSSVKAMRLFFLFFSLFLFITYSQSVSSTFPDPLAALIGAMVGLSFFALLLGFEKLFKDFNIIAFNVTTLGLLFGWVFSETAQLIIHSFFNETMFSPTIMLILRSTILLTALYFGVLLTLRAADKIVLSFPFLKIDTKTKKKKILLDPAALIDSRFFELAQSGLLDESLLLSKTFLNELKDLAESSDDAVKTKAKKQLDIVQKLESLPNFNLELIEIQLSSKDQFPKLVTFAKELNANILTSDFPKIYQTQLDGVKVINLNLISQVLKPVTMGGEVMTIKVQRYGKEPRQGVGYLEDGTMVVINGGGEFIGENIKANVLSVKHTSSGRMIFCNVMEPGMTTEHPYAEDLESSPHNFFAV